MADNSKKPGAKVTIMAKKSSVEITQVPTGKDVSVYPPIKAGALNRQGGVRLLHSRVIKAALKGQISVEELSKLSYSLNVHSKIIENETLSDRLVLLEKTMEGDSQ
jgi:hypothetical protein